MKRTLIDRFLDYMRLARSASENTLRSYRPVLEAFQGSLQGTAIQEATPREIRAFLGQLLDAGNDRITLRHRGSVLRSFYRWAWQEGIVSDNPANRLRLQAHTHKVPCVPSVQDAERLIEAPPLDNWTGARDRAIFETLYSGGLRVAELVALDMDDVDFDRFVVHIRSGKGDKSRYTPIGPRAAKAIREYRAMLPTKRIPKGLKAVFLSASDRSLCPSKRITTRSIRRAFVEYAKRAGLTPEATPHTLRHCCGTHMLNRGANVRVVQTQLGHVSIASTERYLHLTPQDLSKGHRAYHPRA